MFRKFKHIDAITKIPSSKDGQKNNYSHTSQELRQFILHLDPFLEHCQGENNFRAPHGILHVHLRTTLETQHLRSYLKELRCHPFSLAQLCKGT